MKVTIINGLAGTGKTTLATSTYDSGESVFLAFTRNAAQAFADKAGVSDDSFRTIHSYIAPYAKNVLVSGSLRDNRAFKSYCKLIPTLIKDAPYSDDLLHEIWGYSNEVVHPQTVDYLHAHKDDKNFVYNYEMILIYGLYALRKQAANPLRPHIKNLIVDEYQDVSRLQYEIVKELVREDSIETLVFLGDANQRIFQFAIGDFELSKQVRIDFGEVEELTLKTDYRHTKELLSYIDTFAKQRCGRTAYEIPESAKANDGSVSFSTSIADAVNDLLSLGLLHKEITVISRTNRSCYNLALYIQEELKLPINAKFSLIDCILAKLSLSLGAYIKSGEFDDFVKLIGLCRLNGLGFDIGIKSRIKTGELTARDESLFEALQNQLDKVIDDIQDGKDFIAAVQSFKPLRNTFLHYANKDIDTAEFIATTKEELNGDNLSYTIVADLLIRDYFSDVLSGVESADIDIKSKKNGICVSTVHRYKGLENNAVVFCPEYETNSICYSLSNDDYLSEENILYTAITRPLDHLRIVVRGPLENLHPSLYKLFPHVADMEKCGLVSVLDGALSIPNTKLTWCDKIQDLDYAKYSLDRETHRDSFILLLKSIEGKDGYRLESIKMGNRIITFVNNL
ncbi:hypothetical protein FACS1894187_11560 [Synergistales bacterium]|nr:hypothetical protein FACS1894187_11560 [Synergistales bacterium]